jgi:thiamine pyrophosphate-dependent acetolactate synthase large subunit-like protein
MGQGNRRASDLFVECLEAEGVKYVFGIPGEETLDLNQSLANSSVSFVPVRHEQGGAYMADMYGRLTGRAGVWLRTLGPGAMNLVTAIGDAYLDRAPHLELPEDILISDVGLHKLWIGRMFPAHEPNTVLIANGLAGTGFAVPCSIVWKQDNSIDVAISELGAETVST